MAANQRSIGTVKWFSGQKGFGFIAPDDGGEDLFVHQTEIRTDGFRTLRDGQQVEYVVDVSEDGRSKAADVVIHAGSYRFGGGRGGGSVRGGGRVRFGRRGSYGRLNDNYGGGYERSGGYGHGGGGGGTGGMECYNCGRPGHLARECYQNSGGGNWGYGCGGRGYGGRAGRGYGGRSGRAGRHGGGGGRACYHCGEEGHFARDCAHEQ